MNRKFNIPMYDMISCLSHAIDLVSPLLSDHNLKVAAIASFIMEELGRSEDEIIRVIAAGLLHDIGALSLKERINILSFEINDVQRHAELGYRHVKTFSPLSEIATIIRYHHYPVSQYEEAGIDHEIALASSVIYLADRVSILIRNDADILSQTGFINDIIKQSSGRLFYSDAVQAYLAVSEKEAFWLTVTGRYTSRYIKNRMKEWNMFLNIDHLYEFAKLFGRVIDFRSSFTAVHSNRVSRIASALAEKMGMSRGDCRLIGIAGLLHDLGKLAVPTEILEKRSALTQDEWNIVRKHTFYTYSLLSDIEGFETISRWASSHHERLDGTGYPFHYMDSQLSLGERVVAVADMFTALTESRPYRAGLSPDESLSIISDMVKRRALDSSVVEKLKENLDLFNQIRIEAENEIAGEYSEFIKDI